MKRSKNIFIFDSGHIYLALISLLLLAFTFNCYYILLIIYLCFIIKKMNYKIVVVIIVLFSVLYFSLKTQKEYINEFGIVTNITKYENNHTSITVKTLFKSYEVKNNIDYKLGDLILLKGKLKMFKANTVPNGFNKRTFKLSKGIYGVVENQKSNVVLNISFFKLKKINFEPFKYINGTNKTGNTEFDFLFRISTYSIVLIIIVIRKILFYLNVKEDDKSVIYTLVLLIINFIFETFIILWYGVYYLIKYVSYKFNFNLTKLDLVTYSIIIMILLNINIIYSLSFITFSLIQLFILLKTRKKILNFIIIFLIVLPVLIINKGYLDIVYFIFLPMIIYIFRRFIIIILILACFINIGLLDQHILKFIDNLNIILNKFSIKIYFFRMNDFQLSIYYLFLFSIPLLLKPKIFIYLLIAEILFLFILGNLKLEDRVIFLDCGQGDSAVIIKNEKIIVVDCYQGVTSYLRSINAKKISYLILTHSDLDHIKEAKKIMMNFHIDYLVLSKYDSYGITHNNILYIGGENLSKIDEVGIDFLGPIKRYSSANDSSIVFQIKVRLDTYLFTGDIEKEAEMDLVNKYGSKLKSKYIKVPHHGSKTSSSKKLLDAVDPTIAVISCGEDNKFKFPHEVVYKKYIDKGIIIYQTNINGSIEISNNNIKIFPP